MDVGIAVHLAPRPPARRGANRRPFVHSRPPSPVPRPPQNVTPTETGMNCAVDFSPPLGVMLN